MATEVFAVTTTPVRLTGLAEGKTYVAQNTGANDIIIFSVTGTTLSTPRPNGFIMRWRTDDTQTIQPVSGESIWVRTKQGTSRIAYDEVLL